MPTARRRQRLEDVIAHRQAGLVLVAEDLHDPHNIGAMMRSCDAFGIQAVHAIFETQQRVNLRRVGKESSASASLWLDIHEHARSADCLEGLGRAGFTRIGTLLDERAEDLYAYDFTRHERIALVIGNEHRGLSETAAGMVDQNVYIPMRGVVQSLNVSVTAALTLAEITRQRRAAGRLEPIDTAERERLRKQWGLGGD